MTTNSDLIATVIDDMFFNSKINGAAAEGGRRIERIKSMQQLEGLSENPPALILIDLNSDRLDLINAARNAECDYVLPRSAFTQSLPEIITGNFGSLARYARES